MGEGEYSIFRHSGPPHYQLNRGLVASENPERRYSAKDQWFETDLPEDGLKLAKKEAKAFFEQRNQETGELLLDPTKDALFFVSSDLVRAAETGKIFLDEARERGFEIILPREGADSKSSRNFAEKISEGYIRRIQALTLDHLRNQLREEVFQKEDFVANGTVKYAGNISAETLEGWKKAREIIEKDNRGSWGANYAAHSEEIAKIFPDVKSAETVYRTKFRNMLRLIRFAEEKMKVQKPGKSVKVLGFSHENSFIYFLNKNFGETIAYCESIGFKINEKGNIVASAKGKEIELDENSL